MDECGICHQPRHVGKCKVVCVECRNKDARIALLESKLTELELESNKMRNRLESESNTLDNGKTFDKRAYQREYMRKRRAGGKHEANAGAV